MLCVKRFAAAQTPPDKTCIPTCLCKGRTTVKCDKTKSFALIKLIHQLFLLYVTALFSYLSPQYVRLNSYYTHL